MTDVFICYHHSADTEALVSRIAVKLKEMNISCWYDIAGEVSDVYGRVQREIEGCTLFLFIWDSDANEDSFCKNQVYAAFDADRPIIPFRLSLTNKESPELKFYCNRSLHIHGGQSPKKADINGLMTVIANQFGKTYYPQGVASP